VAVPQAQLEDFGSGLTPVTQGFVVNVRDAESVDAPQSRSSKAALRACAAVRRGGIPEAFESRSYFPGGLSGSGTAAECASAVRERTPSLR
jgi:hypothetical protein